FFTEGNEGNEGGKAKREFTLIDTNSLDKKWGQKNKPQRGGGGRETQRCFNHGISGIRGRGMRQKMEARGFMRSVTRGGQVKAASSWSSIRCHGMKILFFNLWNFILHLNRVFDPLPKSHAPFLG